MNRFVFLQHRGGEPGIPLRFGRGAMQEVSFWHANIVSCRKSPGPGSIAPPHQIADANAGPVRVAVVEQPYVGGAQLCEQQVRGCLGLSFDRDQQSAVDAEPVCSRGDDGWILANKDGVAADRIVKLQAVAQQLAGTEPIRFALLRIDIHRAFGCRIVAAAKIENQHRCAQFVAQNSHAGPGISPFFRIAECVKRGDVRYPAKNDSAEARARIQRVAVPSRRCGQFRKRNSLSGQPADDVQCLAAN